MAKTKTKTPEQIATKIAKRLMSVGFPEIQAMRGGFVIVGVSNHTDAEQRHMVRSQETKTIRKKTRLEKLKSAGTIEQHELAACEWYAEAHSLGYDTLGITANYEAAGGGGMGTVTHLARYKAQMEAREDYDFARSGIPPYLLAFFERIVIEGQSMSRAGAGLYDHLAKAQRSEKIAASFRLAANCLHGHIAHVLPVEG